MVWPVIKKDMLEIYKLGTTDKFSFLNIDLKHYKFLYQIQQRTNYKLIIQLLIINL